MLEKGRLYSLRKDGTKDSMYLNIKRKKFVFGSSELCTVRIYTDGIYPEHCVLTIGAQGKAYLKPLNPSALTLVNGIKIKHKVCLQDNDVMTINIKEFQWAYPPNILSRSESFDRPILPYSKQIKPAQKSEILSPGKNLETSQPFRKSTASNINYSPKKQICIIQSDIFEKVPEYLLKLTHQELVNILYKKINFQEVNSSDKFLMKYRNQYVKESAEERRDSALKLYEFISFLRGLLNRSEYLYALWPILESVWKYCTARANEDILFLPLKSLHLKGEITVLKKSLQSKICPCTSKNPSPVSDTMSEVENSCINSLEVSVSSNRKMDGQKQNQYSSRKISISYKKRVSLAVKRYHLRKRKSTMMAKAVEIASDETLQLSGEKPQMKEKCRDINSGEQDILNLEKQQTTKTKRKRGYNRKEKGESQDQRDLKTKISIEVVEGPIVKFNTNSEQTKEKPRNKKAAAKIDLKPGKENIAELMDNSSGNQVTIFNLKEQNQSKERQISKPKGLKQESEKESTDNSVGEQATNTKATKGSCKRKKKEAVTNKTGKPTTQECDTQLSCCQRITRSMAKSRH